VVSVPFLRLSEAKIAGQTFRSRFAKSAEQILREDAQTAPADAQYDVFLSHAYQDADMILGIREILRSLGLRVYVDWIDDQSLDRTRVGRRTAGVLRQRMRRSSSLVYVHSTASKDSAWMPWELGYFDGFKGHFVWILPLVQQYDSEYAGQEYLGLYPSVDQIEAVAGKLNLGFRDVNFGDRRSNVPLMEAIRTGGIYFPG
jgi:hypothetical protein